jgi:hypothetical protein
MKLIGIMLLAILPQICAGAQKQVTFAVMGDVPYSAPEYPSLQAQLKQLPMSVRFVMHVGDIKPQTESCVETIYSRLAVILRQSPKPFFILLGDNEWNDCQFLKNGWKYWKKHLALFDQKFKHDMPASRQKARTENIAWLESEILFVGLSLVGGRVHDQTEWAAFLKDAADWVEKSFSRKEEFKAAVIFAHAFPSQSRHGAFAKRFIDASRKLNRPILYIHGDGYTWRKDNPFADAPKVIRVQLTQGGKEKPLLVTVKPNLPQPFMLKRQLIGEK